MEDLKSDLNGLWFVALLLAVFIILKLAGAINWSWLWVLSPLWIPFAIVLLAWVTILIYMACKHDKETDNEDYE